MNDTPLLSSANENKPFVTALLIKKQKLFIQKELVFNLQVSGKIELELLEQALAENNAVIGLHISYPRRAKNAKRSLQTQNEIKKHLKRNKMKALELFTALMNGDDDKAIECLNQGVSPYVTDKQCGYTHPLHVAAGCGCTDAVKALIHHQADVNATLNDAGNYTGMTPLHYAAENGHIEAVIALIANGAKVNAAQVDAGACTGTTPLHGAAEQGYLNVVQTLVESGADTMVKDAEGKTPLDLAADSGKQKIVDFLREKLALVKTKKDETSVERENGSNGPPM